MQNNDAKNNARLNRALRS